MPTAGTRPLLVTHPFAARAHASCAVHAHRAERTEKKRATLERLRLIVTRSHNGAARRRTITRSSSCPTPRPRTGRRWSSACPGIAISPRMPSNVREHEVAAFLDELVTLVPQYTRAHHGRDGRGCRLARGTHRPRPQPRRRRRLTDAARRLCERLQPGSTARAPRAARRPTRHERRARFCRTELGGSIPQTARHRTQSVVYRAVECTRPQEQRADHAVERRILGIAGRHGRHGDALSRRTFGAAAGGERVVREGRRQPAVGTGRSSTGCSSDRARDPREATAAAPSFLSGAGEGSAAAPRADAGAAARRSSAISITTTENLRRFRPSRMRRAPTR